ncbi:ATP-binding cassette domain-containing protein [candidate division KSB3 bacterium]|uniref:ATP-binding cassette domain-containing protein n=1 Tax=candidate division KSB3 bacterium TaxID=2044937 RepID=A0A9D5Q4Z1_9BACT|nr:ATP-binding cassette domain-containing protein [candidate division KSB3 bacterium]MBD3324045.1 ATP-binding cassette domain-containing protein [candidate division KSB3 bacterium]
MIAYCGIAWITDFTRMCRASEVGSMQQLLSMQHISKAFFGVHVLKAVNFDLNAGEVHILLGENGAGKSTLIKILSGAYALDAGQILLEGEALDLHGYTPKEATDRGVVTIYQNFHLVPHLSVAENISLADFTTQHGIINWKRVYENAREVLRTIKFSIDPKRKVQDLSVSEKQMLEIAIALSKHAKILIMDEPTAAISKQETETLFALIHEIKQQGIGIIYISHKLEEIKQIGDRITILRDGKNVSTITVDGADLNRIVALMTGHEVRKTTKSRNFERQEALLECQQLSVSEVFQDVNFTVHKGEILGLTGLVGSGKTELARAVFGIDPVQAGTLRLASFEGRFASPKEAIQRGIGYLPEDRDDDGLCLNMGVKENISLVFLSKLKTLLFSTAREKQLVSTSMKNLRIKAASLSQYVKYLSGGNKQKVVFAKWLSAECQFLILDEPTIGIDVGAREEIYELIHQFVKDSERAVLFISSDIQEILNIADRILVMAQGRIVAELHPKETTKQRVMEYCLMAQ